MGQRNALGIALSGGGSRAIAFHRGTVRALCELRLAESIDVISTVSGGSVFGAAWMSSLAAGEMTEKFLAGLVPILRRGFVRPALTSLRALKVALPGYNRTHLLAEVFGDLVGNRRLEELPERPALCLNTAVLNHGMPGRFAKGGFSCRDVGVTTQSGSYPETKLERRTLGFAAAASAAFPFALPPVTLDAKELPKLQGSLAGHSKLYLTDGGVLENLGVERLLSSSRFGAGNIIQSDAGVAEDAWVPSLTHRMASLGVYALSRQTLSRLLAVMNDKQNKTMRQLLLRSAGVVEEPREERRLWFVRIDQTWDGFFQGISDARLRAVAGENGTYPQKRAATAQIVDFLDKNGVDLAAAKQHYDGARAQRANAVRTNFTGLDEDDIEALELHAMWQVYACRAVYGPILEPDRTSN